MALFTRQDDKAAELTKIPLFARLSKKHRLEIAKHVDEVTLPPKTKLTVEGKAGHEAYLIVKGSVTVRRKGRKLATRGKGNVIGEMSLIDNEKQSATCTTDGEVAALVMSRSAFNSLLDNVPGLSRAVLAGTSRRLREAEKHLD